VVYVGFDNGDDLGMKGGDSALPIWADFIQGALKYHPEWNSDWAMPPTVRRAEIDIRNGSLIRELDGAETLSNGVPSPTPSPSPANAALEGWETEPPPPVAVYVTDVPAEFRRVELFVSGTLPNRAILNVEEEPDLSHSMEGGQGVRPAATPLNETWQDSEDDGFPTPAKRPQTLNVTVCPLTGLRATPNCPTQLQRTFGEGSEPREFCPVHSRRRDPQ
jgi:hypothetical protein